MAEDDERVEGADDEGAEQAEPDCPPAWRADAPGICDLLATAEVLSLQLTPDGSNYTFYAVLEGGEAGKWLGIYKPVRGEAPLHDFPSGTLYKRERASYLVSEALGWGIVPPTVVREGPHGVGTMQLFIPSVRGANYFTFREERADDLRRVALFDVLTNNADRKGSHCLLGLDGRLWGIDHGLTFNDVPKLRTVIWDFQGDPMDEGHLADAERLLQALAAGGLPEVADLLAARELEALLARIDQAVRERTFPPPPLRRATPWPPL